MAESSNQNKSDRANAVAALMLAIPPALALTAAAFPGYMPIPFVEVSDPVEMRPVLLVTGIGLLIVNTLFFFIVRRYVTPDGE
jgi:FtsH-binding integral membrane protein